MGRGAHIARREHEVKRFKLDLTQNDVIENEKRIIGSLDRKTINTPGSLSRTISVLTSFQIVDQTAEEGSGYPAPPDRSAAEVNSETSTV